MPYSTHYDAVCGECENEFPVTEVVWPGTRLDPPDGMWQPEECPECGEHVEDNVQLTEAEPPDPY